MVNKAFSSKLIFLILVLCIIVPLVASGCTQSNPTTTNGSTSSSVQKGGTLRIGANDDAQNLGYPAVSVKDVDYRHVAPAVECLGYYDKAGNVVPWLASGWKEDPAAKTITISLKKGIKFHDGTDFNAEACKWNFQQFIDAKRNEVAGLTSMDVIDDSTLRLNFSAWNNSFVSQFPFISQMISPTAFQKNGKDWCITHPVGTGPFKFVSWQRDVKLRYEKFDNYWQKGKPYLDAIEIIAVEDSTTRLASFEKHEFDIIEHLNDQPMDMVNIQKAGKYTTEYLIPLGSGPIGVVGDSANPKSPFADLKVRQAVSYAINTKDIVDNVLHGLAKTCVQFGQPGYWGYNDNVKGLEYNPDKARALLKDAGYGSGFDTTLLQEIPYDWTVAVQSYLKAVGINVTIDVGGARFPDAILHKGWTGLCVMILKGGADITPYIGNTFSAKGFIWANSTLHNDELEKMCADVQSATDFNTKQKAVQNAQSLIFDKYNILTPVYHQMVGAAKYPNVHDEGLYQIDDFQWTPADAWVGK
jgi:peptide/nickel transport system substrate-binding protein